MTMNIRLDYVTMKFYILHQLLKMLIEFLKILILNINALIFKLTIIVVCLIFFQLAIYFLSRLKCLNGHLFIHIRASLLYLEKS
jgi:hypothetical protein